MNETVAPTMTAQDYIAQIREELFELEGKLDRVELVAEQARRGIDTFEMSRRVPSLTAGRPQRSWRLRRLL